MIIFAVDASSFSGSAAVWRDGDVLAESFCNVGLTHSETLLPLCDEVFSRAGITPADVDVFAVTDGPGSFTGLRIGMGVVKGMAFATGRSCVAVPTLEALAYGLCPNDRTVVTVLDARQKRVYAGAFDCSGDAPQALFTDEVVAIDDLPALLAGKRVLLVGDAARLCYTTMTAQDAAVAGQSNLCVRAANVAAAAKARYDHGLTCDCGDLAPRYIQLPQAERERLARQEGEEK